MQIMENDEVNDYVFSRLKEGNSWVILQGTRMEYLQLLVAYMQTRPEINNKINKETCRILVFPGTGLFVGVINKELIGLEQIALFFEASGNPIAADLLKKDCRGQDILAWADGTNMKVIDLLFGLDKQYTKWRQENQ